MLSAVYAGVVCLSICVYVCVCICHTPVLHQNVGSQAAQSRQPCVNSHQLSQWEALGIVIFDPPQNRHTLTNR